MRIGSFRFTLWELGGAFGDLGTLLPLLAALILVNGVSSTGAFFIVGLAYILAGLYYRVPIPVQPFKSVSAIAIVMGLSASVIAASGLVMAVLLLLLAATGLIGLVARLFPRAVIRGVQLSVALLLIKAGAGLAGKPQLFINGPAPAPHFVGLSVGWLLAIASGVLLIVFLRSRRLPASLAVLSFGLGAGVLFGPVESLTNLKLGLALPVLHVPALTDFSTAFILLVLPQIPLTLGNAVFATADTAGSYFGDSARRVTHRSLLTTMGVTNLVGGLLGGIPVCHGSGGVTAHFKMGARTGGANLIIGGVFLVLALFVHGNALPFLSLIPYAVLGVMVAFVGLQHAWLVRDVRGWHNMAVVVVIAGVTMATDNLALGFACGILLFQGRGLLDVVKRRRLALKKS